MALHPIFSVLLRRPDLLLAHLAGYADLMRQESQVTGAWLVRRAIAWAIAILAFVVFLMLAGVAAMMAALQHDFHWMLLLAPGLALVLAIGACGWARRKPPQAALSELRAQLQADVDTLRSLGSV
jgi:peptidoglycan/LPS O-acetylase OafA/YrhL